MLKVLFIRRTITNNHIQEPGASPYREGFVQSEGEYHSVKYRQEGPCDSSSCLAELLQQV